VPVGVLVVDGAGLVHSADAAALATLLCDGSLVGRSLLGPCSCPSAVGLGPARGPVSRLEELVQDGTQEQSWLRHDGSPVRVRVTSRSVRLADGDGWVMSLTHPGDRRTHALGDPAPTLERLLVDKAGEVLAALDTEGRVVTVNEAVATVLGCRRDAVLGRRLWELADAGDASRLRVLLQGLPEDGRPVTAVFLLPDPLDPGRKVELTAWRSEPPVGALVRLRAVADPRPRSRNGLREEPGDGLGSRTSFLSSLSHELRTPLNAVLGFAQLLELDDLTEAQSEAVQRILSSGRHMLTLVSDTLAITSIAADRLPLSLDVHELGSLCEQTRALLAVQAGEGSPRLSILIPEPVTAHVDAGRVQQILLNLVGNALKYCGPDGEVVVHVAAVGDRCVVRVMDDGPGIPPAERERVFLPFERLARDGDLPGSGLGLPLARQLARAMGGDVQLDQPVVGTGSCFVVTLPLASNPHASPTGWALREDVHGELLYVEDNDSNVRLVERLVQRRPHVVLDVVGSLAEARRRLADKRYDAVLLDLHLPDGRGEELLELDVATTFVVLTGDRSGASRLSHGLGHRYLTLEKPLDVEKFLSTLDSVLTVPVARRPPRGLIPGPR